MERNEQAFFNFIVESWRFSNLFAKITSKLSNEEKKRYSGRLEWYKKQMNAVLKECGYKFVDLSGETYNSGMALTPINIDEFRENECLVVDYMMEPIVMDDSGNIVKTGTAVLRRQGS